MLPTAFTTFMAAALYALAGCALHAQVQESFSDGELHHNPAWSGDTARFRVNSAYTLQLQATGADTSYISTPHLLSANGTWQWDIWLRLQFAPSDNNFLRWYLLSSSPNLKAPLNGYYIRIGENGNNDGIRFYRQNGNQHTLLASGSNGTLAANDNTVRLRVLRDPGGSFGIYADFSGNYVYLSETSVNDSTFINEPYTGIWCKYTAGNSSRFYADDIRVQFFVPDMEKPRLVHAETGSSGQLKLRFNEAMESVSYMNPQNYILNGAVIPDSIRADISQQEILLFFAPVWAQESIQQLAISGLQDLAGNQMQDTTVSVLYARPEPYGLVINEIMADPSPTIGLPDCEFVELYNRKDYPQNLAAFQLQIGNSTVPLPAVMVPAKGYALIFAQAFMPYFPGLVTAPVSTFPAINNSGTLILLKDTTGQQIHEIRFQGSWYLDPVKDDGGFTLEQKNPDDLCSGAANWAASAFTTGGTPGFQNSLFSQDLHPPEVRWIFTDSLHAQLCFNKKTDVQSIHISDFSIDNGTIYISAIQALTEDTFLLTFSEAVQAGKEYTVVFSGQISDCAGMPYNIPGLMYIRRYVPAFGDVLITEIMADPTPVAGLPAEEYIELFNTLDQPLNLENWRLQTGTSQLSFGNYTLMPKSYALAGPKHYDSLPVIPYSGSFNGISNETALVQLFAPQQQLIHRALYDVQMFSEAPKKEGGWSQEMLDYSRVCTDHGNRDGSRDPRGGTPALPNSRDTVLEAPAFPRAVYRGFTEPDTLLLYFSEALHPQHIQAMSLRQHGNVMSVKIIPDSGDYTLLRVKIPGLELTEQPQKLELKNIAGCENNLYTNDSIYIRKPGSADLSGLKWNEILFDPRSDGKPYIEWINAGDEAIELKNVYSCLSDTQIRLCTTGIPLLNTSLWLLPGEIIAFSTDPLSTLREYSCSDARYIRRVAKLPMPTLSGGTLGIFSPGLEAAELVYVNASLQLPFLSSTDGVALERIQPAASALEPGNWTSAAQSCNFGSPGAQNSQYMSGFIPEGTLSLSNDIFSPDSDGYEDLLGIHCTLPQPGMLLSLYICDELGRRVRTLCSNCPSGLSWEGTWDGSNTQGEKCAIGPYVVIMEAFDAQGHKSRARRTVVLASRL
ncbi:MAG: lamin tail domain-containing protein [Flavobacteriales bacterium]